MIELKVFMKKKGAPPTYLQYAYMKKRPNFLNKFDNDAKIKYIFQNFSFAITKSKVERYDQKLFSYTQFMRELAVVWNGRC